MNSPPSRLSKSYLPSLVLSRSSFRTGLYDALAGPVNSMRNLSLLSSSSVLTYTEMSSYPEPVIPPSETSSVPSRSSSASSKVSTSSGSSSEVSSTVSSKASSSDVSSTSKSASPPLSGSTVISRFSSGTSSTASLLTTIPSSVVISAANA